MKKWIVIHASRLEYSLYKVGVVAFHKVNKLCYRLYDRYVVQRVGENQGPRTITTAADYMKWWYVVEVSDESEISDNEGEMSTSENRCGMPGMTECSIMKEGPGGC